MKGSLLFLFKKKSELKAFFFKSISLWFWGLLVLFFVVLFLSKVTSNFLTNPPIWPDEVLFFRPVIELLHAGKLSSPFWDGVFPGVKDFTFWMPPGYFVFQAFIYKFSEASLVVMRTSNLVLGILSMSVTALIASRLTKLHFAGLSIFLMLCLDPLWQRASLIGRPDMLCLFLMLMSIYVWIVLQNSIVSLQKQRYLCFGLGLLSASAALVHPFGLVVAINFLVIALIEKRKNISKVSIKLGLAGATFVGLPYLTIAFVNWHSFTGQMIPQFLRKSNFELDMTGVLHQLSFFFQLPIPMLLVFLAAGLTGLYRIWCENRSYLPLLSTLLSMLVIYFKAHEIWYGIYFSPFVYLGFVSLCQEIYKSLEKELALKSYSKATLLTAFCLILFFPTFLILSKRLENHIYPFPYLPRDNIYRVWDNYQAWGDEILESFPKGSRVLVASTPDPSFALMKSQDVTLFSFSSMPVEAEIYRSFLESMDYFIIRRDAMDPIGLQLITKFSLKVRFEKKIENGLFTAEIFRQVKD